MPDPEPASHTTLYIHFVSSRVTARDDNLGCFCSKMFPEKPNKKLEQFVTICHRVYIVSKS